MYVSGICAEGIFVSFAWWLKNMISRLKIAPFSNEHHFENWIPKKKTIAFFRRKLSKLQKKAQFCMWHYIFPKTRGNKNKQWTHLDAFNFFILKPVCRTKKKPAFFHLYEVHVLIFPALPRIMSHLGDTPSMYCILILLRICCV